LDPASAPAPLVVDVDTYIFFYNQLNRFQWLEPKLPHRHVTSEESAWLVVSTTSCQPDGPNLSNYLHGLASVQAAMGSCNGQRRLEQTSLQALLPFGFNDIGFLSPLDCADMSSGWRSLDLGKAYADVSLHQPSHLGRHLPGWRVSAAHWREAMADIGPALFMISGRSKESPLLCLWRGAS
jgi:hypothetical protein